MTEKSQCPACGGNAFDQVCELCGPIKHDHELTLDDFDKDMRKIAADLITTTRNSAQKMSDLIQRYEHLDENTLLAIAITHQQRADQEIEKLVREAAR